MQRSSYDVAGKYIGAETWVADVQIVVVGESGVSNMRFRLSEKTAEVVMMVIAEALVTEATAHAQQVADQVIATVRLLNAPIEEGRE